VAMFAKTLPPGVTYTGMPASARCTGHTQKGSPCRTITLLGVVVNGTTYPACDNHGPDVARREIADGEQAQTDHG
jgi:hypothetical protein